MYSSLGAMAARNTLDKCLDILKVNGKPGRQWIKIRKLLAPTKPNQRCIVFKSFQFPVLHAFDEDPNAPPSTMGAKLKAVVLTCLCSKHPDTGHATTGMVKKEDEKEDGLVNATTAYAAALSAGTDAQADAQADAGVNNVANTVLNTDVASRAPPAALPLTATTTTVLVAVEENLENLENPVGATVAMNPEEIASKLEKIEKDKEDTKTALTNVQNKLEKEGNSFSKERTFKKEKIKLTVMKRKSNAKA